MRQRVEALCQVLDLELYGGPPRAEHLGDAGRLEGAWETTDHTLASTGRTMDYEDKARAMAAVYDLT